MYAGKAYIPVFTPCDTTIRRVLSPDNGCIGITKLGISKLFGTAFEGVRRNAEVAGGRAKTKKIHWNLFVLRKQLMEVFCP